MEFRHFLVTRFNVNIAPQDFPFRLSETWLAERFEFFRRFCFPSVAGQEEQNFTWLVLFDKETPARFRRLIGLFERYPNFVPLFVGGFETVMPAVKQQIMEALPEGALCLTTRLDNDDAIARGFVRTLQATVRAVLAEREVGPQGLYVNFPNGLQYHQGTVYDFRDVTNAFVSYLEAARPPRLVYRVDHPSIYDVAPVAQVETPPIFLQHVHGGNVYNYIRGEPVTDGDPLAPFVLEL